jgi:signal transduction histidine kinase
MAMKWLKKIFDPLITFIGIQLVWILMVIFWVYWFVGRHKEFRALAERYRPELLGRGFDWIVLTEGLLLLIMILAGIYVIFLYWRRQTKVNQQQKEILSQITHELKSPLASIQLHLETIRLRKPSPEKLERFLDTMLADTERLNNLINNLLMAAKLEKMRRSERYAVLDFSAFVAGIMAEKRTKLPRGGSLTVDIEPGIKVSVNPEGLQTVIRNLFENALLYSPPSPDIRVTLRKTGRTCQLTFQDRGIGISKKDQSRVFQMFFRVRSYGESIRGTGLGLYIVKSLVNENGGKIKLVSEGEGKGSTFIITFPLAKDTGTADE